MWGVSATRVELIPITRIYALPQGLAGHPALGGRFEKLYEWAGHLPLLPKGERLGVAGKSWRICYHTVTVDVSTGENVLAYMVQPAEEEPRL